MQTPTYSVPRPDLRALGAALAAAAGVQTASYAAWRWYGGSMDAARLAGLVAASIAAVVCYRLRARYTWRPAEPARAAAQGKKRRAGKDAERPADRPALDPVWAMRAVCLVACVPALMWGMPHVWVTIRPDVPPWHHEVGSFALALCGGTFLLVWGARFWLPAPVPMPMSPMAQRVRDYLPATLCFLGSLVLLWLRMPELFAGELHADTAQGLFFSAYDAAPRVDGEGVAGLPNVVAYVLQACGMAPRHIPGAYQVAASAVLAACVSAFAWPVFRPLLASDLARVLICAALACQPDDTVKTLAHVGVYTSVVVLLLVWRVFCSREVRPREAAVAGWVAAMAALSHPAGAAFVWPLSGGLLLAAVRRQGAQALFCLLSLPCACLQVWASALVQRGTSLGPAGDVGASTGLALKLVGMLPIWGVGGKAVIPLPAVGDETAYVLWLCGVAAASACLLQVLLAPGRRRWLGLFASAWLTAAGGVAAEVLRAPDAVDGLWTGAHLAALAQPMWFVPCLAVFLALAVGIGGSALNKHLPWALALWLFAGYPFGLGRLPRVQGWPARGFSAWQALAPQVFSHEPPRGCIPVDPFPEYLGMDCQLLHSVPGATGLGGWMTFFNEIALPPPPPAEGWSVDGIGIAFNKTPPLDSGPWHTPATLVAMDAEGHEVARSEAVFDPPEIFTWFAFPAPLEHVAKLKLVIDRGTSLAMGIESQQTREPFWIWLGRGQPEEGGEGVHLAEQP